MGTADGSAAGLAGTADPRETSAVIARAEGWEDLEARGRRDAGGVACDEEGTLPPCGHEDLPSAA